MKEKESERVEKLKQFRKQITKLIAAQRRSEELTMADAYSRKSSQTRDELWTKTVDMAREILGY